jgi:hypothetical protein
MIFAAMGEFLHSDVRSLLQKYLEENLPRLDGDNWWRNGKATSKAVQELFPGLRIDYIT